MTSGVTERDRAKADRQAAILHEAARLFAERGFSGVSLEDLGAAVGVSGPAVYRHFANKQALLGAILVRRQRAASAPAGAPWSTRAARPTTQLRGAHRASTSTSPSPTPTSSACRTATSRASATTTATPCAGSSASTSNCGSASSSELHPDAQRERPPRAGARVLRTHQLHAAQLARTARRARRQHGARHPRVDGLRRADRLTAPSRVLPWSQRWLRRIRGITRTGRSGDDRDRTPETPRGRQRAARAASSCATAASPRPESSSAARSAPPPAPRSATRSGYQEGAVDFGALPAARGAGLRPRRRADGREPLVRQPARLALHARDTCPRARRSTASRSATTRTSRPTGDRIAAHVYAGETDVVMGRPEPRSRARSTRTSTPSCSASSIRRRTRRARSATWRRRSTRRPRAPTPTHRRVRPRLLEQRQRLRKRRATRRSRRRRTSWAASRPSSCPSCRPSRASSRCSTPGSPACRRRPTATARSSTRRPRTGSSPTSTAAATTSGSMPTPAPTIFNRLEDAGISWKVYFDELQLVSLTGVHARSRRSRSTGAPSTSATCRSSTRTPRTASCPRTRSSSRAWSTTTTTSIRPFGVYRVERRGRHDRSSTPPSPTSAPARSSSRDVYDAIRASATADGSNAMNTLLLITFDEHGGTYDHVAPPTATPPVADAGPGRDGLHVRPARRARPRDRRVGVHPRRHDHPRRDAPRRRHRDAQQAPRAATAHPTRRRARTTCSRS